MLTLEKSGKAANIHIAYLLIFSVIFIWSFINPHDLFTWFLEVFPALIGLAVILYTYNKFKLTTLTYTLIFIHAVILVIGGHYTYAEMPLFNRLRDDFHLARNYYDRVGHFAQGFVPAIIAREVLLRTTPLQRGKMLSFIVVFVCLGISAFYEFIEWWVSLATEEAADAFLGTQGDVWDTQWDMFTCFAGSIISLLTLSKLHDKYLME